MPSQPNSDVQQQNAVLSPALSDDELRKIDAYWRACNYLCVGMIYLRDNPLLRRATGRPSTSKIACWDTGDPIPGQTFTWVHLNRLIRKYDLDMIYISRARAMARRRCSPTAIWKVRTRKFIRRRARTKRECSTSSAHSPFPVSSAAIARRRCRDRFTKAANWATASRTPSARLSTIPT